MKPALFARKSSSVTMVSSCRRTTAQHVSILMSARRTAIFALTDVARTEKDPIIVTVIQAMNIRPTIKRALTLMNVAKKCRLAPIGKRNSSLNLKL